MANALYDKGREAFGNADIDYLADVIKIVAASATYVVNIATDEFLEDIPVGSRVATSVALTSKSNVAGVFDADDVTFDQMSGDPVTQFAMFADTGDESTSRLICYWDTGVGLPFTPGGNDVVLLWDDGANKILKL